MKLEGAYLFKGVMNYMQVYSKYKVEKEAGMLSSISFNRDFSFLMCQKRKKKVSGMKLPLKLL